MFSVRNRPALLSPEEVYPKMGRADFDKAGRPHHYLAYTSKPIFYEHMHELADNYSKCEELKDKMMMNGVLVPPPSSKIDLIGSRWITQLEFRNKTGERISTQLWNSLMSDLERLADHPYSIESKEFLMKFRVDLEQKTSSLVITPITYNEEGRPYVQAEGKSLKLRLN